MARMKSCRFGVLFFGMGLTMTRGRHFNAGALLALATDLNEFTHFVAAPVRGHGNVTGADNVVSWQTGYPVRREPQPRLSPLQPRRVHHRRPARAGGEADAALIIASDPASNFPKPAIEHLRRIPVISLDPKATLTGALSRVAFTTATYGINVAGTVYRMDNVPITLRPAFDSPYPSDEEVLTAIRARVRQLLGGNRLPAGTPLARAACRRSTHRRGGSTRGSRCCASSNGRVYDPANGLDGEVRDVCIRDGRIVADVPPEARRHRRARHGGDAGRRRHPLPHRRHQGQPRAQGAARGPPARRAPAHALHPVRHRRHRALHVRHRLSLRGPRLHHRHGGGGHAARRAQHAGGAARHARPRQGLLRPDGQQRAAVQAAAGGAPRGVPARPRLVAERHAGVRPQAGQSRGRRGVEGPSQRQHHRRSTRRSTPSTSRPAR